jgi:hypothetical protein
MSIVRKSSRSVGVAFLFAALLAAGMAITVDGQSLANEPIAFTGHGALFDRNGRQIEPTLEFLREAQAWYRARLMRQLPAEQRSAFSALEGRVTRGVALDAQSRLVANAHLLDWLIARANVQDRDRLMAKNHTMKFLLEEKLPERRGVSLQRNERFRVPDALRERLKELDLTQAGRPDILESVTANAGAAYRAECVAAGVPVPTAWPTGWTSRGQIPSTEVFISGSLQAEVFTWENSDGMCIALPRYDGANSIRLLGVICLGKNTSKTCFFDNFVSGTKYFPNVGEVVPFQAPYFGGGTELVGGDECTECHAGENPYIIHPNSTALGGLAGLGLPTFSTNWYEPIVPAGWVQNPGPMPSSGACGGCHSAGGGAGRFPHISTELSPYCSLVLNQAITRTMPPFAPGTWAADPHPIRLQSLCSVAPGGSASTRGDPHMTTVDGVPYDFQSAGEFVLLRSSDGMEIQARQEPVSSQTAIGPNGHTGLTTCVSLNTAIAARVGARRVSYEPRPGNPEPSALELRVDGALTTVGPSGVDLGGGGRITRAVAGDGIEIDFPNGVRLSAVPGFWGARTTAGTSMWTSSTSPPARE